jgi:hypothetical protein
MDVNGSRMRMVQDEPKHGRQPKQDAKAMDTHFRKECINGKRKGGRKPMGSG